MVVLHLADTSGPAKTLEPRIARLGATYDLTIVLPGVGSAGKQLAPHGAIAVAQYAPLTRPTTARALLALLASKSRELFEFIKLMRRSRPDAVIVATLVLPSAVAAARLLRIPVIVYAAEVLDRSDQSPISRQVNRTLVSFHRRAAAGIVCCSDLVRRQFAERPGLVTIYPGIRARSTGTRAEARSRFDLSVDDHVVALVGNVGEGRGQDIAICALPALLKHVPAATLVVAGEPLPNRIDRAYALQLREQASALGVASRVRWAGYVDDVDDVYTAADVVVNAARFPEPFGRVAPEALLHGKPVILTDVGAAHELFPDGRGVVIIPPNKPDALTRALATLALDPNSAAQAAELGRLDVKLRFDEDAAAARFVRFAEERISAHMSARRSRRALR